MTVKEAAVSAARILQADDAEALLADAEKTEAELMTDDDVKAFVCAVNLAAAEMSGDGFPIVKRVDADATDCEIPLSALHGAIKILSVERSGRSARYRVGRDSIEVDADGKYTVAYAATSADKTLSEETELGAFAQGLLPYLAARNYCLMTGRTDEAAIWDQRYMSESEKRRLRNGELPRRKWF